MSICTMLTKLETQTKTRGSNKFWLENQHRKTTEIDVCCHRYKFSDSIINSFQTTYSFYFKASTKSCHFLLILAAPDTIGSVSIKRQHLWL